MNQELLSVKMKKKSGWGGGGGPIAGGGVVRVTVNEELKLLLKCEKKSAGGFKGVWSGVGAVAGSGMGVGVGVRWCGVWGMSTKNLRHC